MKNERAIDLGLEVCLTLHPNERLSQTHIAAYIDAARIILQLPSRPFDQRHLWHLEQAALRKLRKASKASSYHQFIGLARG